MEKFFKPKVTTTGSTRSKLLHYINKRVTNILLMATQQVPKENKQQLPQQKINRKKHHPNPASVRDLNRILLTSESNLHRSNQPPRCQGHSVHISARSNGQLIGKHDLNVIGRRKDCNKRILFFLSFSLVESSLKNLSYVLMSFIYNSNEKLIILSRPSSIYRVVLFLTKAKPTTNKITIPILFLIELETK